MLVLLDIKGVEVEEPKPRCLLETAKAVRYRQVERANARTGVVERREGRKRVLKRFERLVDKM